MALDALIYIAVMVPGIVIGIATLFGWLNLLLAAVWPGTAPPQLRLGHGALVLAQGLFSMALVVTLVRARIAGMNRSLIEVSSDLGGHADGHLS